MHPGEVREIDEVLDAAKAPTGHWYGVAASTRSSGSGVTASVQAAQGGIRVAACGSRRTHTSPYAIAPSKELTQARPGIGPSGIEGISVHRPSEEKRQPW